jgi:hypothetical protein
VDRTVATSWRPRGDDDWWQVDLGRTVGLSAVTLNWDAEALPASYSLLLSKDGELWARTDATRRRAVGGANVLERPAAARARFVGVVAHDPVDEDAGVALRDVRVFGTASPPANRRDDGRAPGYVGQLPGPNETPPDEIDEDLLRPLPENGLPASEPPAPAPDDFSPVWDPLTSAALLVIVVVGLGGLVLGAQGIRGGRHRHRRRQVQRLLRGARRQRPALDRLAVQARQALATISSMSWRIDHPRSRRASSPEATIRAGSPGRRSRSSGSNSMPVTRRTAAMISSTDKPSPLPRL